VPGCTKPACAAWKHGPGAHVTGIDDNGDDDQESEAGENNPDYATLCATLEGLQHKISSWERMPIAGAMPAGASLPPVIPLGAFPAIEAGVGAYPAPGASPAIVQASGEGPRLVLGARKFGLSSVLEGVGGHPATIEDPEIIAMLEHIEINLKNITKIDDVLK